MDDLLYSIIAILPRNSEEGSDASRVRKQDIECVLLEQYGIGMAHTVRATLELLENLFTKLSLLDLEEIQSGVWKFVSFPAQLCALSIMQTLADPRQRLLPSGFWHTAGVSDDIKKEQKSVLKALEDHRHAFHLERAVAPPIRFVYVAWGIIKLDGKIVFHRRESKEHENEYGLVGDRTNLQDLKKVMGEETPSAKLLDAAQSPSSELMFQAMSFTLHRELEEEANLIFSKEHYNATPWRQLKPYSQCMGSAPSYALTQYYFHIYHIDLTATGYFSLCKGLQKSDGNRIECTLSEIATGKTEDGSKRFSLDAVYSEFNDDRCSVKEALQKLPMSYENKYKFDSDNGALILSINSDIKTGGSGKEKSLPVALSVEEKTLLLGLGGHAKKLACKPNHSVALHDYGWVEICNGQLQKKLHRLAETLRRVDRPVVEVMESRFFRLSLAPEGIYLDPNWFHCSINSENEKANVRSLCITRDALPTPIGLYLPGSIEISIKRSLADSLIKIMGGFLATAEDED